MESKRSNKGIKKLMCMLLAFVMTISLIPGGFARPDSASADYTRTKVSEIEATSDIGTVFVARKKVISPTFTVTKGDPAYIVACWQTKNRNGEWMDKTDGYFMEGSWRVKIQATIGGADNLTHVLDAPTTVKIDGVTWSGDDAPTIDEDKSFAIFYSSEMEITSEDTRTRVSEIEITSNIAAIFGPRKAVIDPTFTVTKGNPAHVTKYFSHWEKKDDRGRWQWITPKKFTPGTWRATIEVTIDGDDNVTHVFDNPVTAKIDGQMWSSDDDPRIDTEKSTVKFYSSEMEIPADETRAKVSEVLATSSNVSTILGYGEAIEKPTLIITEGTQANIPDSMLHWERKNSEGNWETFDRGNFRAGTWRIIATVKIDGDNASTHILDNPATFKVNGQLWENQGATFVSEDYSSAQFTSPEITITDMGELTFPDSDDYDIPEGTPEYDIPTIDLNNVVYGGTEPYEFSKVTGPDWLNVSADGKITGTRPDNPQPEATATIQVKDADNATKTIEIKVGKIKEKTRIYEFEATSSDIGTVFEYGKSAIEPTFATAKGAPAQIANDTIHWQKKNAQGRWKSFSGKFTEGTWRLGFQVCTSGAANITHVIDPAITAKVNGQTWSPSGWYYANKNTSGAIFYSPEMTISKVSVLKGTTDFTMPVNGTNVTIEAYKAPPGMIFDKWEVVSGDITLADPEDPKTTFVMPENGVKVKATYKDAYNVSVTNGKANRTIAGKGTKVTIKAEKAPSGKMFDKWEVVKGNVTLENPASKVTAFTMPENGVEIKATYKDIPAPAKVTVRLYGYDDIRAIWAKVEGVTGYKVYYKKSTSKVYKYKGSTKYSSMRIANLADGAKYYVKIVPCVRENGKLNAGKGKVSSGIYTLKKLNTPKVAKKSSNKVTVKWNNIYGETGYQISKSTSKTKTGTIYTVKTTKGKSKIISAKKGKIYYYKVRAYKKVNGKGIYGPWSKVRAYKLR